MTNTPVLLPMKLQLLPFQTKHGVQVVPCMKKAAPVPPLMERRQNLLEEAVRGPGPMSPQALVHLQTSSTLLLTHAILWPGQLRGDWPLPWRGSQIPRCPLPFPHAPGHAGGGLRRGEDLPARALQGWGFLGGDLYLHRGHRLPGKRGD